MRAVLIAIGSTRSDLISEKDELDKIDFIKEWSDVAKLIAEVHHTETEF